MSTTKLDLTGGPVHPAVSALRPLGPHEITVNGGFWGDRQELNARVVLSHCEQWMERIGWTSNFDRAADGTVSGAHAGIEFVDSEVYKLLEAMAWELGRQHDESLDGRYRSLVARVVAAQEPDGYVHTSFGRPGQRARYSDLEWGHELYCFGHLLQAAVARLRSGHDDGLVGAGRRLADHLWQEFGPDGRNAVCGHPEIEVALAEFGRATGEPRYLELARLFVERRGTGTLKPIEWGQEYFQDEVPVRQAHVLRGHAVRALYLASGALDVATDQGDEELARAVELQWENTVARRTYITGGMGSHHQDEAFGSDYELPPDRAYSETCAGIASVMLSWRLLLRTGDPKYADLMERTLLNNILASPRQDGRGFFYTNTLHQRVEGNEPNSDEINARALATLRAPWFEVSCCPTNVARTLASVHLYFATATDDALQIHQYGDADIRTQLQSAGHLSVTMRTSYPDEGRIDVVVADAPVVSAGISLRVPAWAKEGATLHVNGEEHDPHQEVRRIFQPGDTLTLSLPMRPRVIRPHPHIDAVRGTVAVERGPLVLCLESVDLPSGTVNDVSFDPEAPISEAFDSTRIVVEPAHAGHPAWPYSEVTDARRKEHWTVNLVPYYSWGNRGPSTMRVWIPVKTPSS
ncbi:glycoside hydrolase family 127 protein [Arthrobacter sp. ISL-48]|uniref:glycoside hydrolase family 127 protein n=1 Tax=Arthrobacter sp. ISL-48 TaxID=2819110 RepID=UPI001BE4E270|nr:beta-L-arabinofuranosidase domain-containing protein [Arthrobacter sp. ISL-48]MBT2534126.1 glycoside hydrolase family 127 protein [Arthrobacter sp. ISL-48]